MKVETQERHGKDRVNLDTNTFWLRRFGAMGNGESLKGIPGKENGSNKDLEEGKLDGP